MKVLAFSPFGMLSQESGVIALVTNYLRAIYPEVQQLRCNGMFSLCDRDAETDWSRDLHSCLRCIAEQKSLAHWSGVSGLELSPFLSPQDAEQSRRWVLALKPEELLTAQYNGILLYELCSKTFNLRFAASRADVANRQHEQFLRRLILASLRMCMAVRCLHNLRSFDLVLVAGGQDYITRAFVEQSRAQNRPLALFSWQAASRAVKIRHPHNGSDYLCEFVLEDITSMRSDAATWPPELIKTVQDLLLFLDTAESQLDLPLARQG